MMRINTNLLLQQKWTRQLPLLTVSTLTLAFAVPSHADWYLDHYEADGSNSAPEVGYPTDGPWPNNPANVDQDGWWNSRFFAGGSSTGAWTASASGKVTAVFKWAGPGTFAGGKVGVRVESQAWAESEPANSFDMSPGTKLLPNQQPDSEVESSPSNIHRWREGKQLFVKNLSPGETEFRQEISLKSNVSGGAGGGACVSVAARYFRDDRTVTISRAGSPTPKRETDATLDMEREEWIGSDGTGHGHSIYSYHAMPDTEGVPYTVEHPNTQQFNAGYTYPGTTGQGWQGITSWNWSPTGSNPADTIFAHSQLMPKGNMFIEGGNEKWGGSETGKSGKTISYSVTDSDGAGAEAKYELTLHDKIEKRTHTLTPNVQSNVRPHPMGGMAVCSHAQQTVSVSCTDTYNWSVSVSLAGKASEWMAKVFNINVSGTVGASEGVTSGYSVTDMTAGQGTYLEIFDLHDVHSGLVDKWSASGYDGGEGYEVRVPSVRASGTQVHVPYLPINPPPGGGGN